MSVVAEGIVLLRWGFKAGMGEKMSLTECKLKKNGVWEKRSPPKKTFGQMEKR